MGPACYEMVVPVEEISANGEQCLNYLSQPRGQPQTEIDNRLHKLHRWLQDTMRSKVYCQHLQRLVHIKNLHNPCSGDIASYEGEAGIRWNANNFSMILLGPHRH